MLKSWCSQPRPRYPAKTDGSRCCSTSRSAGYILQRRCNARSPYAWTPSSPGWRRRAPSTATATGSGGRSAIEPKLGSLGLFPSKRLSAQAASFAISGSAPRAGRVVSTFFLVSFCSCRWKAEVVGNSARCFVRKRFVFHFYTVFSPISSLNDNIKN